MKTLILISILGFSTLSNAAELTCTAYSATRGGTKFLGVVNTSDSAKSSFILTASGELYPISKADTLSDAQKLASLTISFSNRNNSASEPFIVLGQFQKIEGMDTLFNRPLLSTPGNSAGLNVNYMDKDLTINCGQ